MIKMDSQAWNLNKRNFLDEMGDENMEIMICITVAVIMAIFISLYLLYFDRVPPRKEGTYTPIKDRTDLPPPPRDSD